MRLLSGEQQENSICERMCECVCVCCLCMCVCMLRICCIVLLLLPPLVQPASSALFWSSLGHKTTTYLLARARLSSSPSLPFPSLCVCARVFIRRSYRLAIGFIWQRFVCLPACLPLLPCLGLAASRSPRFSQSSSHNFIQDKSVYHVLMPLSFYAAFFVPSFYYLFHFRNVN